MVTGGGSVEGADLLIKAFLRGRIGLTGQRNDISSFTVSPPRGWPMPAGSCPAHPGSGWACEPGEVTGVRVQGCLTRTARV